MRRSAQRRTDDTRRLSLDSAIHLRDDPTIANLVLHLDHFPIDLIALTFYITPIFCYLHLKPLDVADNPY